MNINEMKEKLAGTTFDKVAIEFPISYDGGGKFDISGAYPDVEIAARGAAYMNSRVRGINKIGDETKKAIREIYSWKSFTELHNEGHFAALAKHINDAYDTIEECGNDRQLYALVIDGTVRGIVTDNFDFLPHEAVIEQIEANGLADHITGLYLDTERLTVYLDVDQDGDRALNLYIKLVNGHAGFDSLNYKVVMENDNFEFVVPDDYFDTFDEKRNKQTITQRNRHLSRIDETFSNLVELFERVGEITVNEKLKNVDADVVINKINDLLPEQTKRQLKIMDGIISLRRMGAITDGYDVVNNITKRGLERGYNAAIDGLLDPFFKWFIYVDKTA